MLQKLGSHPKLNFVLGLQPPMFRPHLRSTGKKPWKPPSQSWPAAGTRVSTSRSSFSKSVAPSGKRCRNCALTLEARSENLGE